MRSDWLEAERQAQAERDRARERLDDMTPVELVDCPQCDGAGELVTNDGPMYAGGRDPQLDRSWVCPTCNGDCVVPPGTPIFDPGEPGYD
jgi:hypothetical protein